MTATPSSAGRLFAVTGRPVLHSRSPDMFAAAFEALGLPHRYLRLAADTADEALRLAAELGLSGLNLTAPFKSDAAELASRLSPRAEAIGATNLMLPDGQRWQADNTDGAGVVGALRVAGLEPDGRRAVVLGAGGAGRAAAQGLQTAGAEVCLVNRTFERARSAAARIGCQAAGLGELEDRLAAAELLVACLPTGAQPVEAAWLRPGLWVLEADYAAGELTVTARKAGASVVGGLDWLLHQALAGFERMCGQVPPADAMRTVLDTPARRPAALPNLALVGFMASGKTAVGRSLAERLGWRFVDLDEVIEDRAGRSIPDLFAEQGEPAFRALERRALADVAKQSGQVIACGGGAVIDADNRRVLNDRCAVFWLWAPLSLCLERSAGSRRPLLAGVDGAARPRELLTERHPLYAAVADLVLGVEGRPAEGLAERIADEVRFCD